MCLLQTGLRNIKMFPPNWTFPTCLSLYRCILDGESGYGKMMTSMMTSTSTVMTRGWTEGQKFIFSPCQTLLDNLSCWPTLPYNWTFFNFEAWIFGFFFIYASKFRDFGKNFILVPGFIINLFVFLQMIRPVPVLWFTLVMTITCFILTTTPHHHTRAVQGSRLTSVPRHTTPPCTHVWHCYVWAGNIASMWQRNWDQERDGVRY